MSIKGQLTLAAGLAVGLSTSALFALFQGNDWVTRVLGAVLVVVAAGLLGRRLVLPRVLQPLLGLAVLFGYLSLVFAGSSLAFGLLPTSRTLDMLQALVQSGQDDIAQFGPPVPTRDGMVLLTAAGVGGLAVLVDLVAVVLDRAAVAGLPLLVMFAVPSAVLPGGIGGTPFVLGALGWLSLLLVEGSERVGRWGTPMRSSLPGARPGGDDSSLGRVGRRIGFAAVSLAVVIPALIPGLDHRLIGGSGGGGGTGSGSGPNSARTYNALTTLRDQLTLPTPTTLLVYRTDDPHPDYLRMTTLGQFTGDGWKAADLVADRENAKVQRGVPTPIGDGGNHQTVSMRVVPDQGHLDVHWLPVPFGPTKVDVKGNWLWDPSSQTVFSASNTTKNLPAYSVQASRVLPERDVLARAQVNGIDPSISQQYGQPIDVSPYVKQVTAKVIKGQTSEYDKAVALQRYFTSPVNGYVYNLRASQPTPGQNPVDAFLLGKNGFCEQYATTMAAMLRVAGIPSRVAVGFTPGTQDSSDKQVYSVTTSDAHAWPEAWFAGTGWVRFEPTPATSGSTVPDYSVPAPAVPATPTDPARRSAAPTGSAAHRPGGHTDPDLLAATKLTASTTAGAHAQGSSRWLLVPVTVALLLVLPLLLTLIRRRRRWAHPNPLTAWEQLRDDATDVGYRWHPADSPRAAAQRLADSRGLTGPVAAALDRVAIATERARYALPGRLQDCDLRPDVSEVRDALQECSPTLVRLRAAVLPPSTLGWATHGVGERLADLMERFDNGLAALSRPFRRRAAAR